MGKLTAARWRAKWALVTGASAGIGKALAEQLAAGGTNLVLTARRRERLEELAGKLAAAHKIRTEFFVADLAQPDAPSKIFEFTGQKGIEISLLVNKRVSAATANSPPRRYNASWTWCK